MNCHLYDLAENTAGLFFQLLSCNHADGLRQLFHSQPAADLADAELNKGSDGFYLSTPESCTIEESGVKASFFVICFQIHNKMQTISGRKYEFLFSEEKGYYPETLQIRHVTSYPLLSLCPEADLSVSDYSTALPFYEKIPKEDCSACVCSLEEFTAAKEALASKIHKALLQTRENFAYVYNPYLYRSEKGLQIAGTALIFKHKEDSDTYQLSLSLYSSCIAQGECREEECIHLTDLAPLPANPMTPPQAAEMIKRKMSVPLAEKGASLSPEDARSILCQTALWTKSIRSCDPSAFIQEALDTDASDLLCDVMIPKPGYAGFQEQFDMMARMKALQPKKQGVHTLCTPYIVPVSKDTAAIYYLDFGWTMMGEAFGREGDICPAMPDIGRYIFKLRKKGDRWKVYEVNWGPVIQYGMWRYDQNNFGK